ncbi:Cys-tRNA(Pro)/Cys-tRNA(Cys) deacylase [Chitinophaga skermanii]|uniref:Cys-tRNA(Pro)/Cys-tRNA(Cys) deacylase n=1 Tax=Chitinophaga skermanii TaxID=331697 RepID=A0A327QVA1_9BACT|nr:Cys-tRNA(Pro) deacylase [Chitinophaga skermanii]RAJ08241.1 Cys-tRNA(Pro)/Cys-tRNA(Cys) deacylase [Chitinophaga skermanii]
MITKTNAARMLDSLHISYEVRTYEVHEDHLSAVDVAESIGIEPERLFKTLVLKGNIDPYIVAVIPGNAQLDLKKIAKHSGNKNCDMLPMKDLLAVTGYIRGGCSPIGMKKQFPTYIEELATLEATIVVSAGKRGLQIILDPQDLAKAVNARFVDIV